MIPAPYVRGPRVHGWVHAAQHQVFTRALTTTERTLLRQRDMGLMPAVCHCGGVTHTESRCETGSGPIVVRRCTGCGTHVERV